MSDDHPNGNQKIEANEIVIELSEEDRGLLEVIQNLLLLCDRITYGQKQREIDEADHFKPKTFVEVRDIFDKEDIKPWLFRVEPEEGETKIALFGKIPTGK